MSETLFGGSEASQEAIDEAFRLLVHDIEVDFGSVSDPVLMKEESDTLQDPFGVSDLMVKQTIKAPDAEAEPTRKIEKSEREPLEFTEPPGSAPRPDKWTPGDEVVTID